MKREGCAVTLIDRVPPGEGFIRTLRFGGYLMMGHAESLNGMDLPLEQVTLTVYRRSDG